MHRLQVRIAAVQLVLAPERGAIDRLGRGVEPALDRDVVGVRVVVDVVAQADHQVQVPLLRQVPVARVPAVRPALAREEGEAGRLDRCVRIRRGPGAPDRARPLPGPEPVEVPGARLEAGRIDVDAVVVGRSRLGPLRGDHLGEVGGARHLGDDVDHLVTLRRDARPQHHGRGQRRTRQDALGERGDRSVRRERRWARPGERRRRRPPRARRVVIRGAPDQRGRRRRRRARQHGPTRPPGSARRIVRSPCTRGPGSVHARTVRVPGKRRAALGWPVDGSRENVRRRERAPATGDRGTHPPTEVGRWMGGLATGTRCPWPGSGSGRHRHPCCRAGAG